MFAATMAIPAAVPVTQMGWALGPFWPALIAVGAAALAAAFLRIIVGQRPAGLRRGAAFAPPERMGPRIRAFGSARHDGAQPSAA
jgi:hypothetical protein